MIHCSCQHAPISLAWCPLAMLLQHIAQRYFSAVHTIQYELKM